MPDSQQPPFGGPAYHEGDLDALLSGEAGNTPVALRPVESTLAALRAAPTRRELSDEEAARAAFRASAAAPLHWAAPAEHGTVNQDTLVLPLGEHLLAPADRRRPRAARHRHRRGATWGGRRSAIALSSVGVVAVIGIAVAVTGAIPGSIGHMVSFGAHPTSAASSAAPTRRAPDSLMGSGGAARPTRSPAATSTPSISPSATTGPATLCREYYQSFWQQNRTTQRTLFDQLAQLAGGRDKVSGYCLQYHLRSRDDTQRHPVPSSGGYPGAPGSKGNPAPGNGGSGYSGGGNSARG